MNNTQIYIGIDPGKSGAWAAINGNGQPVISSEFAGFTSFADEIALLKKAYTIRLVVLEQVHAMPRQGVSSMFTFGANYGGWQATLELLELPTLLVRPQAWQKALLGAMPKGESKPRALAYINRLYPTLHLKKSQHGLVDAFCLAEYGRKHG